MPELRTREISAAPARCRRCRNIAIITVRESRFVRSWTGLLDRGFDPAPTRTAHCGGCGMTYPIRRTDDSSGPAASRRDETDAPRGRDWIYPTDQRRASQAVNRE